jgi:hypothetical protein
MFSPRWNRNRPSLFEQGAAPVGGLFHFRPREQNDVFAKSTLRSVDKGEMLTGIAALACAARRQRSGQQRDPMDDQPR